MKRTNIEIDETLVEQGKRLTGMGTCKEVVNFALKQLVRQGNQKELLKYFGKIEWQGNLNDMRALR